MALHSKYGAMSTWDTSGVFVCRSLLGCTHSMAISKTGTLLQSRYVPYVLARVDSGLFDFDVVEDMNQMFSNEI